MSNRTYDAKKKKRYTPLYSNKDNWVILTYRFSQIPRSFLHHVWLMVSAPLKNISQMGLLFPTEWKVIKFMFQTTKQWLLTIINHHYPILNQSFFWLCRHSGDLETPHLRAWRYHWSPPPRSTSSPVMGKATEVQRRLGQKINGNSRILKWRYCNI
jgi:hypothetical protein